MGEAAIRRKLGLLPQQGGAPKGPGVVVESALVTKEIAEHVGRALEAANTYRQARGLRPLGRADFVGRSLLAAALRDFDRAQADLERSERRVVTPDEAARESAALAARRVVNLTPPGSR